MRLLAQRIAGPAGRDDALQDALLAAWRHFDSFDPERGSARSWLAAITTNAARRVARRARSLAATPVLEPATTTSDMAADRVDALHIDAAVDRLPSRQRLTVQLYYFVGLSVAETAAAMHCAEGTVKASLSAARAALRTHLSQEFS